MLINGTEPKVRLVDEMPELALKYDVVKIEPLKLKLDSAFAVLVVPRDVRTR